MKNKVTEKVKDKWYLFLLLGIFMVALKIRLLSAGTEWLQAYDPYFHLRYTSYIAENGILPAWDPLSYFPPGRPTTYAPLMYYLTAYLFPIFESLAGTLINFAKHITAYYGAAVVIPAYLVGKEFSDWKAGIISAAFMGTIPAAIRRTSAGFYSTDPFVLFFSLLTVYFFARTFKRRDWTSYALTTISLVLFSSSWLQGWYVAFLAIGATFLYYIVLVVLSKEEWNTKGKKKDIKPSISERMSKAFNPFLKVLIRTVTIILIAITFSHLLGMDPMGTITEYTNFVFNPSDVQIVNVSVAELQSLDVLGGAWNELYGRTSVALVFLFPSMILLIKRKKILGTLFFAWAGFTFFFVTRGIRFMLIFAPAVSVAAGVALSEIYRSLDKLGRYAPVISLGYLASVLISLSVPSIGVALATLTTFGIFFLNGETNTEALKFSRAVIICTLLLSVIIVISQGVQLGSQQAGEPISDDWAEAYDFIKHNTSQDAVVGSWWDPGHRISGIAQRRNIADGYHCPDRHCDPGLNTRISDLGRVLVTDDEETAVETLEQYQGNASELYWIASQDLIGKYQWPQYFATGCEAGDPECPLYSMATVQDQDQDRIYYQGGLFLEQRNDSFVPGVQDQRGRQIIENLLIKEDDEYVEKSFDDEDGDIIPGTAWIHPEFHYMVYIPEYQSDSLFTRMYFYEEDLEHFDLEFSNDFVKIYQLDN